MANHRGLRDNRPEEDWPALGRLVTDLLACLPSKQRYLVILDEFPLFVTALFRRSERLAVHFLQWFRATRQSFEQTHFLLGGSINLEGSLARSGHSALVNDLEVFRVRPFPAEVANRFVQHLLAGQIDTSREQLEAIAAEITGVVGVGVPFYLQLVTGQLVDAIRLDAAPISRETVRWVYDERVLGPDCRVRFDHYRSRLSEYYDPDNLTRARLILDVLCDGEEHEEAEILDRLRAYGLEIGADGAEGTRVLAQLEADYYIECRGGRVRFLHRILADWWRVNIRPPARGC